MPRRTEWRAQEPARWGVSCPMPPPLRTRVFAKAALGRKASGEAGVCLVPARGGPIMRQPVMAVKKPATSEVYRRGRSAPWGVAPHFFVELAQLAQARFRAR